MVQLQVLYETYIKVCLVTIQKVLKIKRQLNFVNVSYLFTSISYLEKTYTITAREPSIYIATTINCPYKYSATSGDQCTVRSGSEFIE